MGPQWLPVYVSLLTPIATLAIVMVGFLYNNGRMSDFQGRMTNLRMHVDGRIDDLRDMLRAEMAENHGEMLARFGDLDTRLTRIESRMNLKQRLVG